MLVQKGYSPASPLPCSIATAKYPSKSIHPLAASNFTMAFVRTDHLTSLSDTLAGDHPNRWPATAYSWILGSTSKTDGATLTDVARYNYVRTSNVSGRAFICVIMTVRVLLNYTGRLIETMSLPAVSAVNELPFSHTLNLSSARIPRSLLHYRFATPVIISYL